MQGEIHPTVETLHIDVCTRARVGNFRANRIDAFDKFSAFRRRELDSGYQLFGARLDMNINIGDVLGMLVVRICRHGLEFGMQALFQISRYRMGLIERNIWRNFQIEIDPHSAFGEMRRDVMHVKMSTLGDNLNAFQHTFVF